MRFGTCEVQKGISFRDTAILGLRNTIAEKVFKTDMTLELQTMGWKTASILLIESCCFECCQKPMA